MLPIYILVYLNMIKKSVQMNIYHAYYLVDVI